MERESARIPDRRGGVLAAERWRAPIPAGAPPGSSASLVVVAHGRGSGKGSPRNQALARALAAAGIDALLVDLSGHGESGGDPKTATIADHGRDVGAALTWAARHLRPAHMGVAGSSTGAAAAVLAALADPRAEALVLRAPSGVEGLDAPGLSAPTLILIGDLDPGLGEAEAFSARLRSERRRVILPGTGHLFEGAGALDWAVRESADWLRAWLVEVPGAVAGAAALPLWIPAGAPRAGFRDRTEAGARLGRCLDRHAPDRPLVLALPRGGVAVAAPIAAALAADLNVLLARKIPTPGQEELALGALVEGGTVVWNEDILAALGIGLKLRGAIEERTRCELAERAAAYREILPADGLAGRTVILVDDGVATGATLHAAILAAAASGPAHLVVALPGGAYSTLNDLAELPGVERLVALAVPDQFEAVCQLYERFDEVSVDVVCDILRAERARRAQPVAAASTPPSAPSSLR